MPFPIQRAIRWDPPSVPVDHRVEVTGLPAQIIPAGTHAAIVTLPSAGVYTGRVTAFNAFDASAPVDAVEVAQGPAAPINVRFEAA